MKLLFLPLTGLYCFFSYFHKKLYEWGLRKVIKLSKPVISVGNLTVGGTGKTAVVDELLYDLEAAEVRSCVLTRGYGRKSHKDFIVSETSTAAEVGDEPLWLYKRHPQTQVLVSQNRAEAALSIKDVDIFILDDGLQHYELKRDYEIILLDATRPLWHYELLPYGFAREPWSALRRADMILMTRANQATDEHLDTLSDRISKLGVLETHEGTISFAMCEDLFSGEEIIIPQKKVFLVSGIGNPESFEKLVRDAGSEAVKHQKFADHFHYAEKNIAEIFSQAKSQNAELILITEKDAVKWKEILKEPTSSHLPVGVVMTQLQFDPPLEGIYELATHNFS